ncbi:hypothetical protein J0X19_16955 [Hymenobacter sp. BT186]|uniref:Leucine-rich repeat domain-containing protein n=2 Tax=Hymenobacter telluris TaxID=2816474 RepID=A0A939JEQ9_9BACT|nr:hypothetical protein [Hymenobacter telluris]MBW3375679.1 hypothetical protein [Hymenobacter norwichensis]
MGQFIQLRELLVLNLALIEVPLWLTTLTDLRYVMLRGTDITKLPATISNLHRLELLRIENCQNPLSMLPESFRELRALRYLSFRDTYLRYLPIKHLPPSLTHLELSYSSLLAGVDYDELHSRFPKLRVCLNGVK